MLFLIINHIEQFPISIEFALFTNINGVIRLQDLYYAFRFISYWIAIVILKFWVR